MQTVHSQVFDCESILVHSKEFPRVNTEDRLSDLAEAAEHQLAAAVGDTDREVVSGDTVLVRAHARLTVVASA